MNNLEKYQKLKKECQEAEQVLTDYERYLDREANVNELTEAEFKTAVKELDKPDGRRRSMMNIICRDFDKFHRDTQERHWHNQALKLGKDSFLVINSSH